MLTLFISHNKWKLVLFYVADAMKYILLKNNDVLVNLPDFTLAKFSLWSFDKHQILFHFLEDSESDEVDFAS